MKLQSISVTCAGDAGIEHYTVDIPPVDGPGEFQAVAAAVSRLLDLAGYNPREIMLVGAKYALLDRNDPVAIKEKSQIQEMLMNL